MTARQHKVVDGVVVDLTDDEQTAWEAAQTAIAAGQLQMDKDYAYKYVNDRCDDLYLRSFGGRTLEYILAEKEARAYKAAGYTGTVPTTVANGVILTGATATQVADAIISSMDTNNAAIAALRHIRTTALTAVSAAANSGAVLTARTTFDTSFATFGGFTIT